MMPAAVCTLELSRVLEETAQSEEMKEGARTHACRKASAVYSLGFVREDVDVIRRLHGDVGDAAAAMTAQIIS